MVQFLVDDERSRVALTSMVSCLFARGVYSEDKLAEALTVLGLAETARNLVKSSEAMRDKRWSLKLRTGFDPAKTRIPKRYTEIVTWKGPVDPTYMEALRLAYGQAITGMAAKAPS